LTSQELVENLGNLNSNVPMDEGESVSGTGATCQGGMARGSDAVDEPSKLTFGAEQFVDPAPMDEDEGVDGTGANSQGGMPCGSVSASTTQDLVENLGNLNSSAPMDEDEDVDKTGCPKISPLAVLREIKVVPWK
jgi:hypothetical protein